MRTISYDEISAVAGAGSPCAGLIAGYAGAIALGVAAGLTDGVALIDGVGIWGQWPAWVRRSATRFVNRQTFLTTNLWP
jgi:hypothetical protein